MSTRKLFLALLILTAVSCDQAPNADPSKPDAYAVQIALEPATGEALQRVALPAEALVALRRADLGDIRLFDSRGKVVPIALLDDTASDSQHSTSVPIYPVVGPASALGRSDLSIRIHGNGIARVVTVNSSAPPVGSAATPAAVLLDTRTLRKPALAIALDVDIPVGRPVTLTLFTSANLKDWKPLAEKVLFRPGDGPALLGGATVALPGVDLRDNYVGISWGGATKVMLRGARIITSTIAQPVRTALSTGAVSLANAHEIRFDLPDMARLAAIRITGARADGVIPAKLFGRDQAEGPWTLLSATTLRPGDGANLLDLAGSPMTSYRLEADRRTAGFSAPPTLKLLFDPVELVVALSGTPPYRLAVGHRAAPATYLTLTEIAPQGVPQKLSDLPQAELAARSGAPPIVALQPGLSDGALDPRKLLLWATLMLGTMVLAFAAIQLLRVTAAGAAVKED